MSRECGWESERIGKRGVGISIDVLWWSWNHVCLAILTSFFLYFAQKSLFFLKVTGCYVSPVLLWHTSAMWWWLKGPCGQNWWKWWPCVDNGHLLNHRKVQNSPLLPCIFHCLGSRSSGKQYLMMLCDFPLKNIYKWSANTPCFLCTYLFVHFCMTLICHCQPSCLVTQEVACL